MRYLTGSWAVFGDFGISYVIIPPHSSRRTGPLPASHTAVGGGLVCDRAGAEHPIGLCAVYKDGWFDKIMRGLVFISPPPCIACLLGRVTRWGSVSKWGFYRPTETVLGNIMILPAFTVALSYISTYIRLIRNNMLENMKQDYVLYANVRGASAVYLVNIS